MVQEPRLFALRLTPICIERRRGDPSPHAAVTVMRCHHGPLCFPASQLGASCDLDRLGVEAEPRFNQRRCSNRAPRELQVLPEICSEDDFEKSES